MDKQAIFDKYGFTTVPRDTLLWSWQEKEWKPLADREIFTIFEMNTNAPKKLDTDMFCLRTTSKLQLVAYLSDII